MSKTRGSISDEDYEEELSDDGILDGANDLCKIPIEKIREELKRRKFHPKYVDKASPKVCVALLRNIATIRIRQPLEDIYSSHEKVSSNFFSSYNDENDEKKKEDDKDEKKKEDKNDEKKETNDQEVEEMEFDPSIFMKDTQFDENGDLPIQKPNKVFNTSKARPLWEAQSRYSDMLIENYVPENVLNSLPLNIQKQICDEMENLTNFIHHNPNKQTNQYMTIPEIIRKLVIPYMNNGSYNGKSDNEDPSENEKEGSSSSSNSSSSDDESESDSNDSSYSS